MIPPRWPQVLPGSDPGPEHAEPRLASATVSAARMPGDPLGGAQRGSGPAVTCCDLLSPSRAPRAGSLGRILSTWFWDGRGPSSCSFLLSEQPELQYCLLLGQFAALTRSVRREDGYPLGSRKLLYLPHVTAQAEACPGAVPLAACLVPGGLLPGPGVKPCSWLFRLLVLM